MREGNKPYSITYKIAYALSNTHHIEYFAQKDYIDFSLLFHDIGRVYLPETSSTSFENDFLLDIGDKTKYLDSGPSCSNSRLTLTNDFIQMMTLKKMINRKDFIQSGDSVYETDSETDYDYSEDLNYSEEDE